MAALPEPDTHYETGDEATDKATDYELPPYSVIETKLGYVKDYILITDPQTASGENKKPVYYEELFMTDCEIYYIILDYNISDTILNSFLTFCDCNKMLSNTKSLPDEIISRICYDMFGYYDLSFLNGINPKYQSRVLLLKYIIDRKCKFGYIDPYLLHINENITILNDTPIRDDIPEHNKKLLEEHHQILDEIRKHYSGDANLRRGTMFYWINHDSINVNTIIERNFYPSKLILAH